MAVKFVWNPNEKGLSVSALIKWIVNPVAFELEYFQDLVPVESWNKNMCYGSLMGAGIEGWIKTRELRGASRLIELQYQEYIKIYNDYEDIAWWTTLAEEQTRIFIARYAELLDKHNVTSAERRRKARIQLPSGREITLAGYTDGEGKDLIFEHKCRGDWNTQRIVEEIDLDLQYNYYLLLYYSNEGKLPSKVWYQHSRRPSGFAYRGPKKRETETKAAYRERLVEYIKDNEDDHFFMYMAKPDEQRFNKFLHLTLYPYLEQFLDWYEYMTHPKRKGQINKLHTMTPYGLYNPYMEGTDEKFRQYALTGSTIGLMRKVR